jgi:hypothetical protein
VNVSVVNIKPLSGWRDKFSMARSISGGLRTGAAVTSTPNDARSGFDRAQKQRGLWSGVGIGHDRDARKARRHLLEQVDPFAADREFEGSRFPTPL